VAIRKLPSGKWQATVRMPNGKRITKTDVLRSRAAAWEHEQRAAFARGEFRDPRAGRITVGQWFERWIEARAIEEVTRDKLRSSWRAHCELQWGRWPMDAITHMEAQEWIRIMERKRRAKHRGRPGDEDSPVIAAGTIHTAAHLMSSLFKAACNERPPIVLSNPFARLDLPEVTPSTIYFYEPDEVQALLTALRELRPDEPQWPALVELGTWVGLRPGELFGLPGNRVDWLRAQIEVFQVMTRRGLREHPKSKRSHRVVPVPRRGLVDDMAALLKGRPRESLIFTMPQGGVIHDEDFRFRIWYPAVRRAGIRPHPPRVMRHTAASWLVQDGVPLYDVQALLGHESFATTQRYAHLAPDAHNKVVESWRRTSDARRPKIVRKQRGA